MKKVLIIVCLLVASKLAKSQNMNWALMNDSLNQSVEATLSLDYGITYGVGYNYVFNTMFPLALHGDVSIPSGENLLDDYIFNEENYNKNNLKLTNNMILALVEGLVTFNI